MAFGGEGRDGGGKDDEEAGGGGPGAGDAVVVAIGFVVVFDFVVDRVDAVVVLDVGRANVARRGRSAWLGVGGEKGGGGGDARGDGAGGGGGR